MADTQMQRKEIGGVKELVILVGILLTVIAGPIGALGVPKTSIQLGTRGQGGALWADPGKECQGPNRRVPLGFRKPAAAVPACPAMVGMTAIDRPRADSTSPAGDR